MGSSEDEDLGPVRGKIEQTGVIEWAAGIGLTRDDVGLVDGDRAAIYDSVVSDGPYQARIALPDGTVVERSVSYVAAASDGNDGPPCTITLDHSGLSPDEAETLLVAYRDDLRLDPEEVAAWRAHSDAVLAEGDGGTLPRSLIFTGPDIGGVRSTVEAGTNRGVGTASIVVEFSWC